MTPRGALHKRFQHAFFVFHWTEAIRHALYINLCLVTLENFYSLTPMMDMMYRPLLPPTQYCPCTVNPIGLSSLPNYNNPSPFFRVLFAPYTPLWINPSPQRVDNSPSVDPDAHPLQQAGIDYRLAFERKKKIEAKQLDAVVPFRSLYIPKGRWHWTHQVTFEDRSEHIRMRGACV